MQNLILSRRFALVFLAFFAVATYGRPPDLDWLIVPGERVGPITAETSEASLEAFFGAGHVRRADVYIGEGSTTQGTAIYPDDTERRIEIIWSDVARTVPKEIRLTGNSSKWHTAEGISLGSTLKDIERLNRFPFRLMGFAWDYAGTIVDCGRGRLAALRCSGDGQRSPTGRLTIVRLAPEDPTRVLGLPEYNQVIGDREFSSGHPAMQSLNPRVYQMIVTIGAIGRAVESDAASAGADDIKILDRAGELLSDEKQWNRADTRECLPRAQTISLFCALSAASIEVLGRYDHRRAALEEVRFAIEGVSDGRKFEHRLMDFNNHPSTTFTAVRRVLAVARARIAARLPASEPSKARPEPER